MEEVGRREGQRREGEEREFREVFWNMAGVRNKDGEF